VWLSSIRGIGVDMQDLARRDVPCMKVLHENNEVKHKNITKYIAPTEVNNY